MTEYDLGHVPHTIPKAFAEISRRNSRRMVGGHPLEGAGQVGARLLLL